MQQTVYVFSMHGFKLVEMFLKYGYSNLVLFSWKVFSRFFLSKFLIIRKKLFAVSSSKNDSTNISQILYFIYLNT